MSVRTTISGPARVVTTIAAPDPQGATVTVIGTVRTAIGTAFGPRVLTTLRVGLRGATGPAGSEVATYTAAAPINGHKLLQEVGDGEVQHADINDPTAPFLFAGMTENAAGIGGVLQVRRFGAITYGGWDWADGSVYLGNDGDPTQTVPDGAAAAIFVVGFGSGQVLHLNPQPAVFF